MASLFGDGTGFCHASGSMPQQLCVEAIHSSRVISSFSSLGPSSGEGIVIPWFGSGSDIGSCPFFRSPRVLYSFRFAWIATVTSPKADAGRGRITTVFLGSPALIRERIELMATAQPSPNDLTRQQLDELDALLQRMLSVPTSPGDATPPVAAPTPTPTYVPVATPAPAPRLEFTAAPPAYPALFSPPPPSSLPQPFSPPQPVAPAPLPQPIPQPVIRRPEPVPPPPVFTPPPPPREVAEPPEPPEPPRAKPQAPVEPPVIQEAAVPKVAPAPTPVAKPQPKRERKALPIPQPAPTATATGYVPPPLPLVPLVMFNQAFNRTLGLFGLPGRALRSGFVKSVFGLAGLGLIAYTGLKMAQLQGAITLPVELPWPPVGG